LFSTRNIIDTSREELRMPCKVHLNRTFNCLSKAKEYRQHQHDDRDPKRIPLWPSASVVPPLRYRVRFSFVESLLQDDKTFTPEIKVVDLSALDSRNWTFGRSTVETVQQLLLSIPTFDTLIG
jgi:hypothetical protein